MCGRYSLTTPVEGLRQLFEFPEQPNLAPRYNIAPTQEVPAVRPAPPPERSSGEEGGTKAGAGGGRQLAMLRWGLIPGWAKDPAIGSRMINARAETLAEKPAFRSAFRRRRCLVPADGFYEWRKQDKGPKQPYWIARPDGGPFAFAGLWERWRDPRDGARVESCTIVTTEANATLRPIYPRMPVILAPEAHALWLDPAAAPEALLALLRPAPEALLTPCAVSTRVNKVANDGPELIAPLAPAGAPEAGEPGSPRLL